MDPDNSTVSTRRKSGLRETERLQGEYMVMEGDLTWGGEHTTQYTDDVLQNCTPEIYVILLTNATPMNSI